MVTAARLRWLAIALPGLSAAAFGCGGDVAEEGIALHIGDYRVHFLAQTETLPVNSGFEAAVSVCADSGEPFSGKLTFDAGMPGHGHGMNYLPQVEMLAPGRFRVAGVLLHMPGQWEFRFGLVDDDGAVHGRVLVQVP